MPLISKIKNILCCTYSEYVLEDDDDDVGSIVEHLTDNQEVSEKPLVSAYENSKIDNSSSNYQQHVIVKSVLRKRRNPSVSTTGPRRRYNILLFGDSLTAGKFYFLILILWLKLMVNR